MLRKIVLVVVLGMLVFGLFKQSVLAEDALTGEANVLWGDSLEGQSFSAAYFVPDNGSEKVRLDPTDYENLGSIAGSKGYLTQNSKFVSIDPSGLARQPEIEGNLKWASVLCGFPDKSWEVAPSYYYDLTSQVWPGVGHYWDEASYGKVSTVGSAVFGPVTLPHPNAYYETSDGGFTNELHEDCFDLLDSQIYFPDYYGVNIFVNGTVGCCAWGSISWTFTRDGVTRGWGMSWLPTGWGSTHAVVVHENGHAFGMNHAAGPGGYDSYGDSFDPMGDSSWFAGPGFPGYNETFGSLATHSSAWNKHLVNWGSEFVVNVGESGNFLLQRVALPLDTSQPVRIIIPVHADLFYTAESRMFYGYDGPAGRFQGEGVVLHEVVPSRMDASWLISTDGINISQGAIWTKGEGFSHNGVKICIEDFVPGYGFIIKVGNQVDVGCSSVVFLPAIVRQNTLTPTPTPTYTLTPTITPTGTSTSIPTQTSTPTSTSTVTPRSTRTPEVTSTPRP